MTAAGSKARLDLKEVNKLIATTAEEAIKSGLSGDETVLLQKAAVLEALRATKDAATPQSFPLRWPPLVIFVVTALLLAYLLDKPDTAVIAFDASTRALDATLHAGTSGQEYVPFSTSKMPVRALVAEGTVLSFPTDAPMKKSSSGVTLGSEQWHGLVVEEIYVLAAPGKAAKLSVTSDIGAVRICASNELVVQVRGAPTGNAASAESAVTLSVAPLAARNTQTSGQACLGLAVDEASVLSITTQLPVRDLSVSGPATAPQGTDPLAIQFPTALVSGKLSFPEVPAVQYKFGSDDRMGLIDAQGLLRRVDWKKDQLTLRFRGTASSVTRSAGQIEQKLIPSRLSHFRASQSDLILAWGVLLYLFGLALSLYKWLEGLK